MRLPADTPELRCTAPHPKATGRICGARVCDILPGTVEITTHAEPAPGCTVVACPRCGTTYRVCPATGVRRVA